MKLTEPVDIMLTYNLPDKKKLTEVLRSLPPGETLSVKIENSYAVKMMVEKFLKNRLYTIVDTVDEENTSILRIKQER